MTMKFDWSGAAIQHTLGNRDHYTQASIRHDLEFVTPNKPVLIDPSIGLYATGVSDNRFVAVWQLKPENRTVSVKFVVPTQIAEGEDPAALKDRLAKLIALESKGRYQMPYSLEWAGTARESMAQRDRFTRYEVKKGIETDDPMQGAVNIDPARNLYASNVSNERYAVVWQLDPAKHKISVKYVVAMQFRTRDPAQLKETLSRVISADSGKRLTLDSLADPVPSPVPPPPPKQKRLPFTL